MTKIHAYYLILRYPTIRMFIRDAFNEGKHKELIDFIFALETEEFQKSA